MRHYFVPITYVKSKETALRKVTVSFFVLHMINYAGLIASEGQTSAQVPQSVHTSASIT
jgi:hypothetical protein